MPPAPATLTLWDVLGPLTGIIVGVVTICGFIIRLMISNAVIRLEGKIDAINLAAVIKEIETLREWRHDFGQKESAYDNYGPEIDELKESLAATRHALGDRIAAHDLKLVKIEQRLEKP